MAARWSSRHPLRIDRPLLVPDGAGHDVVHHGTTGEAETEPLTGGTTPEPVDVGSVHETRLGRIQLDRFDLGAGDLVLDPLKVAPVATRVAVVATNRQRR